MSTERNGVKSARSLESVALLAVVGRFFSRVSTEDEGVDCSWFWPFDSSVSFDGFLADFCW